MREYVATAKTVEEAIQRSWKCRRKPASWA